MKRTFCYYMYFLFKINRWFFDLWIIYLKNICCIAFVNHV